MMMAMARAAKITAKGLARPRRRLSSPGRANMPAPKMPLMTRAVIVQRPIDRTKVIVRPTGAAHCTTRSKMDKGLLMKYPRYTHHRVNERYCRVKAIEDGKPCLRALVNFYFTSFVSC